MAFEDGVFATFFDKAVQNTRESREKGYPVFDDVLFIKIQVPNQVDCQPRPAQDKDKQRFPLSWSAYQTGKEPAESGFPIEQWPQVTVSQVEMLKGLNVKTVEQLAELQDSGLHRLGQGGTTLKVQAQKFLSSAKEMERLRAKIEDLERKLEASEKPKKRKTIKVSAA